MNYLSQIDLGPLQGKGPLGLSGGAESAPTIFNKIISSAIGLMTVIAFIWFVFLLFSGAYGIMSAGGDKQALETAKKRITTGLIGVIVVIAAIFIISLIGELIGLPDILNPGGAIDDLSI